MAIYKKENKLKKIKQSIKKYEVNNPEMARKLKGKLAAVQGQK